MMTDVSTFCLYLLRAGYLLLVVRVALPLWSAHQIDARTWEIVIECLIAVIFLVVIPWRYVFENYAKKVGEQWGRRVTRRADSLVG